MNLWASIVLNSYLVILNSLIIDIKPQGRPLPPGFRCGASRNNISFFRSAEVLYKED